MIEPITPTSYPLKPPNSVQTLVSEISDDVEASYSEFFENTSIKTLQWSNVDVSIKSRKRDGRNAILTSCSGRVQAGQVLALMGPSGSGKSTMLNILANRTKLSHTGSVFVNQDFVSGSSIQSVSAYVQQEDKNLGGLTVRESIEFTSKLANPKMTKRQRSSLNTEVIRALGLEGQRDTIISSPFRNSLSGGQKRRLSLATALVTGPKILFLDEPTSGLDSAASHEVMTFITKFAKRYGLIVIASIHQPSSSTLSLFDLVMLISAGRTCYFGPGNELVPYFNNTCIIPQYCNPAEFLLDLVNTDFCRDDSKERQVDLLVVTWNESDQNRAISQDNDKLGVVAWHGMELRRANSIQACFILLHRNFIKSYRDPLVYGSRLAINIALALVTGTVWLRLPYTQSSIQPFVNCLFFGSSFMALMAVAYAPAVIEDIRLLEEEYANRLYNPLPFVIANFMIGLIWLFIVAMSFSLIVYWLANFSNGAYGFATFTMWLFIDLLAAESMVLLVAGLIPEFVTSLALVSFANGLWLAVGGFLVPKSILNPFWKYAFHYIDFQTYVFQGLMVNQFRDSSFACDKLPNGEFYCMYPSQEAAQGKIAGSAVLDAYGYMHKSHEWLWWLLYSLLIIVVHRLLGLGVLWWRVKR